MKTPFGKNPEMFIKRSLLSFDDLLFVEKAVCSIGLDVAGDKVICLLDFTNTARLDIGFNF